MFFMWCCCSSNLSRTYCKCQYLSALLSWPPVILGRHSASLSAYRRLRWRFDGDKKCGLNKPDIVYFLCEMMWQLSRWVFVICSTTAAFLATKEQLSIPSKCICRLCSFRLSNAGLLILHTFMSVHFHLLFYLDRSPGNSCDLQHC